MKGSLIKACKSKPKSAQICNKIAPIGQNTQNFAFSYTCLKKVHHRRCWQISAMIIRHFVKVLAKTFFSAQNKGLIWAICDYLKAAFFSIDILCLRTYRLYAQYYSWSNVWLFTTINEMVNYYGMWVILTNCVINWVARFPWEENLNQEVPLLLLLPHNFEFLVFVVDRFDDFASVVFVSL